jgi:hypothetical protein
MYSNPFTPSKIASSPDEFFGRTEETKIIQQTLSDNSAVIQGGMGIGKSSLLSRIRDIMRKETDAVVPLIVGNTEVVSIDGLARLVLEKLVDVDEVTQEISVKLPQIFGFKSANIVKQFVAGRHLDALKRLIRDSGFLKGLGEQRLLIIAVDEADKCPQVLARFMRDILSDVQSDTSCNLRFLLSGIKPFFERMVTEDRGMRRFVVQPITLHPLTDEAALELLQTKFFRVADDAATNGTPVSVDTAMIEWLSRISGGHPHLLQLMGWHVVNNEVKDPDGKLDLKDLVNAFYQICYEDRCEIYDSIYHLLELSDMWTPFYRILGQMKEDLPSRIARERAQKLLDLDDLKWFVDNDILALSGSSYLLTDEFLRIRVSMDNNETVFTNQDEFENHFTSIQDEADSDNDDDLRFET